MKKIVAFVPIKMNSQRLANKNILPLNDHPLCYHLLKSLCQIKTIDHVYVYCSNEEIKNYIPKEVEFLKRSETLDRDLTHGEEIYSAFVNEVDADIYVLAHATSPFLRSSTIEDAINKVSSGENDSAFTAKEIKTFCWYKGNPLNYSLTEIPRTQDIDAIYQETSGFYIFEKEIWKQHHRRIGFSPYMCVVDDFEGIDIDTESDYKLAQMLGKLLGKQK